VKLRVLCGKNFLNRKERKDFREGRKEIAVSDLD
jgi:hypothetical protein